MKLLDELKFTEDGLIPAIAQDDATGDILMMAWMNEESLRLTLETGNAVYWSRSRKKLWKKGEESGNVQKVLSMHFDCDADVLLLRINQIGGAACHTGRRTCFYREVTEGGNNWRETGEILFDPKAVYKK